ncbi:MAG: hypothetical protein Q9166_005670 [cf. Caloplaca sp. 2 TL-2023]
MNKVKAQELIAQLERHQQEQIQFLQALLGLAPKDEAQEQTEVIEKVKAETTCDTNEDSTTNAKNADPSSTTSAPQGIALDGPSQEHIVQTPEEWAIAWSNALLIQRIEERAREPGCGGGMRRGESHISSDTVVAHHLADVDSTDSAARFIAANALNDLARFTFERETNFLKIPSEFGQTAFYVIDFDRHRQITLDFSDCPERSARASKNSEVLHRLFKQVLSLLNGNSHHLKTS